MLDLHTLAGLRDLVVLLALAAAVALAERWLARYRVGIRQLSKGKFDPARLPSLTAVERQRLAELLTYERGNLSVYGPYSPFAGSGFGLGGWSFALNTARGAEQLGGRERLTPISFDIAELYAAVRQDIEALELAGVLIENRLLADGRSVSGDEIFTWDGTTLPVTASISACGCRTARATWCFQSSSTSPSTTFLDAHNIDASQFDEQRDTILNQGLLISGGEFRAGSVAVGQHARARTTTVGQGVRTRRGVPAFRRPRQ
jgi:hypothetical protein